MSSKWIVEPIEPQTVKSVEDIWEFHGRIVQLVKLTSALCDDLRSSSLDEETAVRRVAALSEHWGAVAAHPKMFFWYGQAYAASQPSIQHQNPLQENRHFQAFKVTENVCMQFVLHNYSQEALKNLNTVPFQLQPPIDLDRLAAAASDCSESIAQVEDADRLAALTSEATQAARLFTNKSATPATPATVPFSADAVVANSEDAVQEKEAEPNELPRINRTKSGATIEWRGKIHEVTENTADAFQALLKAKGQPVGLTKAVGKPKDWYDTLREKHLDLASLIVRADGNKGYCE